MRKEVLICVATVGLSACAGSGALDIVRTFEKPGASLEDYERAAAECEMGSMMMPKGTEIIVNNNYVPAYPTPGYSLQQYGRAQSNLGTSLANITADSADTSRFQYLCLRSKGFVAKQKVEVHQPDFYLQKSGVRMLKWVPGNCQYKGSVNGHSPFYGDFEGPALAAASQTAINTAQKMGANAVYFDTASSSSVGGTSIAGRAYICK